MLRETKLEIQAIIIVTAIMGIFFLLIKTVPNIIRAKAALQVVEEDVQNKQKEYNLNRSTQKLEILNRAKNRAEKYRNRVYSHQEVLIGGVMVILFIAICLNSYLFPKQIKLGKTYRW